MTRDITHELQDAGVLSSGMFTVPYDLIPRVDKPGVGIAITLVENQTFIPEGSNSHISFSADEIAQAKDAGYRQALLGKFEVYRTGEENSPPFGALFLASLLSRHSFQAGLLDVSIKPHELKVGLRSKYDIANLRPAAAQIARTYPSHVLHPFLPHRLVRLEPRVPGKNYGFPFDQVETA